MPRLAQAAPHSLFVSAPEAAALLGLGRETIYDLVNRDELPHVRLGSRVLIPRRALEELAGARSTSATPSP